MKSIILFAIAFLFIFAIVSAVKVTAFILMAAATLTLCLLSMLLVIKIIKSIQNKFSRTDEV